MKVKAIVILILFCNFLLRVEESFAQKRTEYRPSNEDILNPERGFYYPFLTYASKYTPLASNELKKYRSGYVPFKGAPFNISSSLILRIFVLDGFQKKALTDDLLGKIDADFAEVRKSGQKCIIRFAYNFVPNAKYAPPFNDAPLNIVQQHLAQLAPIFKKNKDVIAIAQLGFIGVWGEGYYTDYYGTPGGTTNQNLKDRVGVLDAYLKALPSPLIVQLRYPTMKQDYFFFTKKASMSSRIGFHNDAFLSSADDMGTYRSYDISQKAKSANTKDVLIGYVQKEAGNTAMGGESAVPNHPYDDCRANGGEAEKQLSAFHFSYINANYNPQVLTRWNPCIEDIKRKLGYRLVMKDSFSPNGPVSLTDTFSVIINFSNEGYAAPFNSKKVSLIMKNDNTGKTYQAPLNVNVKSWTPGQHQLRASVFLPASIALGSYNLLLKVADPSEALKDRDEYAIRFANEGVWMPELAANDLKFKVQVSKSSRAPVNIKRVKGVTQMK
ncbi:DUF4832 domain-containing protein [Chitinophaga ginsengisegetis]|uniref:DUF4832 domain-containing protein n=1 Tax=Chitinophaga ginsengisegetis TaxID=393003 RepID=UPI000DBACF55|nr:DUF4832 domain-containing protein [Chitinophaga ginsengisegetis]MDR6566560.1 hypothetical protein [Chitinophaga ginsengisegetis]MDR6646290.1 hypothetical protein [Chitinophaga ginsengisegetis]MDR6651117.1 hypothetical protein [Chitinophaga ginsengisegetis]